jgi:branched-subunit amino acid transport protein
MATRPPGPLSLRLELLQDHHMSALELDLDNPKLLGGLAALGFYLWRRNMLGTLMFGMLAFTLLRVFHVFEHTL